MSIGKRALIGAGLAALLLIVGVYVARNTVCHWDEGWCVWHGQNRLLVRP